VVELGEILEEQARDHMLACLAQAEYPSPMHLVKLEYQLKKWRQFKDYKV